MGRPDRATTLQTRGSRPTPYPSLPGRGVQTAGPSPRWLALSRRRGQTVGGERTRRLGVHPLRLTSRPASHAGRASQIGASHRFLLPSLEGRGWGWVGPLGPPPFEHAETAPPYPSLSWRGVQKAASRPMRIVRGRCGVICPLPTWNGVPSANRLPTLSVRFVTPSVTPSDARPIRAVSAVSR